MLFRTYLRTLLNDLFENNFIVKAFVNIYYKYLVVTPKDIKFTGKIPIFKSEGKKIISFQSVTGDKIDCK